MARTHKLSEAAALDLSPRTLRHWVQDGAPHDRGREPRRAYLVDPVELRAFIAERRKPRPPSDLET
jgi:hypothetical protein